MSFGHIYNRNQNKKIRLLSSFAAGVSVLGLLLATGFALSSCADAAGPKARNVNVPNPKIADERRAGINENGESVIYLPLGEDVLLPQGEPGEPLPSKIVGPFELRGETLAGALQLILDGTDIPVAFESTSSLTQNITVTNLKGPMSMVVNEVCSLANVYCSFQNGMLVVKDRQVFTVTIPPIVASADVPALLSNISGAVGSITGEAPITDASTRTIVYRASQRTSELARRYFQRLRSNTAMIVYETYIWEVSLDAGNTTGIKWSLFDKVGRFKFGVNVAGAADTNVGTPISIGLPTTGTVDFSVNDVFQFISSYGAVKTISQPQLTVLSGSSAKLRIADTQNYVASISRTTTDGGNTTVSTTTDSVDTGFTLNIGSNWDNSTVYGTIDILLQEVQAIDTFDDNPDAVVQLPQTTERELNTSVRVRPGDLLLIAGLVRERDNFTKEGPGLAEPIIPTSRSAASSNSELVFLLRPRVVVFTSANANTPKKGAVALPQTSFTQPDAETDITALAPMPAPVAPVVELPVVAPVVDVPAPAPVQIAPAPVYQEPIAPLPVEQDSGKPSLEIQPLSSVVPVQDNSGATGGSDDKSSEPSVIVNYDVLGR